ncbi:MarR family winged helix-turn-helix transcriptional regulator [Micromonospora sp. NPDC049366]|uniref:MarR family winged helix-turn-helix transcriptional regulator n=1 Tax=Micromonospora sp. NPDC049366 TaxID=3364271 RepID=UPI0037B9F233
MGDSGNWLDDREQQVWRTFHRLRNQLTLALGQSLQQDSGISEADFEVLAALAAAPDQTMRARTLRAELQWEKSRLAHQIRRMEQRGLVAREECVEDGRAPLVRLTEAGRTTIRSAAPAHAARVRELFFAGLTPAQVEALHEAADVVLSRLHGNCPAEAP